jgi:hypothetical protein
MKLSEELTILLENEPTVDNLLNEIVIVKHDEQNFKDSISKELYTSCYIFYSDEDVLYVGQSEISTFDRCYVNGSSKHSRKEWWSLVKKLKIVNCTLLNDNLRKVLERVLIVTEKPTQNKD